MKIFICKLSIVWVFLVSIQSTSVSQAMAKTEQNDPINQIKATAQEAKFVVSEVYEQDKFGYAVSISGDYAIIGVSRDDFMGTISGTAYIYKYDGSNWVQFQRLVASDSKANDQFGISVSISGTRAIVGAPFSGSSVKGQVYVYDFDGVSWVESHIIADELTGENSMRFGNTVSLFADRIFVGASGNKTAYFFDFNTGTNTWSQTQKLTFSNPGFFVRAVSMFGNTAVIADSSDGDNGTQSGAVYIFEYNTSTNMWDQKQKLYASDAASSDNFGVSVSLYANHLVVGSWFDDNSNGSDAGSAYFYAYNGTTNKWEFKNKLLATDGLAGDFFGQAVAISKDRIAVGAYQYDEPGVANNLGAAYIFDFNAVAGTYDYTQKIIPASGNFNTAFGNSIALDKDTMTPNRILVGASGDDEMGTGAGAAYVFDFNNPTWSQTQKFIQGDGVLNDKFGERVSISGETAVVGAYKDQELGVNAGAVYVFNYVNNNWVFSQKLFADDAASGDLFGWAVSVENNRLVVGAQGDEGFTGSVYVFENDGSSWTQQHKLSASDGAAADAFGSDVDISGDRLLVGARFDGTTGGSAAGSAYVFDYDVINNQWDEVMPKLTASDGYLNDNFGVSVALDGDYAIIGAWADDDNGSSSGAAYIFNYDGTNWYQYPKLLPADIDSGDFFGLDVDIQGQWAIIGAPGDDEMGLTVGSVYVYQIDTGTWVQFQKLTAGVDAAGFDGYGRSISIDGNKLLISSYADDDVGLNSGSVYSYQYSGIWFLGRKLNALDGSDGALFGSAVAISGNKALIGALGDDNNWIDDGAAYIFNVAARYDLKINLTGFEATTISSMLTVKNGNETLSFSGDGVQVLSNLADNSTYDVSIIELPRRPRQTCVFDDPNTGTIMGADVTINMTCTTVQYNLSVRVYDLAPGNSIEVTNNMGDNLILDNNGEIKTFPTKIDDRATYSIDLISAQPTTPNQTCTTNASGTIFSGDTLVNFVCVTNKYTIGGTVTGLLTGNELVLQNNNGDDLTLDQDASFVFATAIDDGSVYSVSIKNQPINNPHQTCTITNATGQLAGNAVNDVAISCIVSPDLIFSHGFENP